VNALSAVRVADTREPDADHPGTLQGSRGDDFFLADCLHRLRVCSTPAGFQITSSRVYRSPYSYQGIGRCAFWAVRAGAHPEWLEFLRKCRSARLAKGLLQLPHDDRNQHWEFALWLHGICHALHREGGLWGRWSPTISDVEVYRQTRQGVQGPTSRGKPALMLGRSTNCFPEMCWSSVRKLSLCGDTGLFWEVMATRSSFEIEATFTRGRFFGFSAAMELPVLNRIFRGGWAGPI